MYFFQLCVKVSILLTCGEHLHDRTILLGGEVWAHQTSLSSPLFIEVSVPIQENERPCIKGIEFSNCFCRFRLEFGTVPTM
jgi:hypothetical protein